MTTQWPPRIGWHSSRDRIATRLWVAWCTGAQDGLASERAYTLRTLPIGVLHGLAELPRGDPSGLTRSAAIVAGLLLASLGYLVGALRLATAAHPATA